MKIILILILISLSGCKKESASDSEKLSEADSKVSSENYDPKPSPATESGIGENTSKNSERIGYVQYRISQLPLEIKYQGSVIAMAKWKDLNGENIVFVTETAENSNEDFRSKELFGYQYLINDDGTKLLWKINDFVKECPLDLTLRYMDKTLEITDLDSNGIGESSFLYRMACKGDLSSDDMKLIMHDGKDKFAIRGIMDITLNGRPFQTGEMNVDPSYNNAPKVFLDYSVDKWNRYKLNAIEN